MKIVFMGTPEFAVPSLRALCDAALTPETVYTQPARRKGRGLKVVQTPVGQLSEELGLSLRQPDVLQNRAEMDFLRQLEPDLIITAAFGRIFRRRLLELPQFGCINLHPSLLPLYRGLSPVTSTLCCGDTVTGNTVYRMVKDVDAGPILLQREERVDPDDTCGSLTRRLGERGGDLVVEVVRRLAEGSIQAIEQDHERASFAGRLCREDGRLDWNQPAEKIKDLVRAFTPWPGTFTYKDDIRVKVLKVRMVDDLERDITPGTFLESEGQSPVVAANPGAVELLEVQCENSRAQDGIAFCNGQRVKQGMRLQSRRVSGKEADCG